MRNILVTGGAGYIGSKLVTKLLDLNHKVTVIDTLKFSSKSLNHLFNHKNFNFVKKSKNLFGNNIEKFISIQTGIDANKALKEFIAFYEEL